MKALVVLQSAARGFLARRQRRKEGVGFPLVNLPDGIIGDVASYLPKPSCALLAAAATAPSSSWRARFSPRSGQLPLSALSKIILSSHPTGWEEMDFGDLEENLARRLSDDDLLAALACIDAASTVEIMKLTNLTGINGQGLELLRSSTVLKQIDLSLGEGWDVIVSTRHFELSEEIVLPILDSILGAQGNSFRRAQFPVAWAGKHGCNVYGFLYNEATRKEDEAADRLDFGSFTSRRLRNR
ncbi:hypothetical protein ACHAXT_005929 [Thalassiosira profunda]